MEKSKHLITLEKTFSDFINDQSIKDELCFNLTQSQVESFVRTKFGYWVTKNIENSSCLIEVNRLDLLIRIDDYYFIIEFGHLLNLLQHTPLNQREKVIDDVRKMNQKTNSLLKKLNNADLKGKLRFFTISLFSDFRLKIEDNIISTVFEGGKLNSGVVYKYGSALKGNGAEKYNEQYRSELEDNGYIEQVLKNGELSLHWLLQEHKVDVS